jgi:hypothetical protein
MIEKSERTRELKEKKERRREKGRERGEEKELIERRG